MPSSAPRSEASVSLRSVRRWLTGGSAALLIGVVVVGCLEMLSQIRPPFFVLHAMAKIAVFMEFHDRGLRMPASFANGADDRTLVPCFRDGAPSPSVTEGAGCHPGVFPAEGGHRAEIAPWGPFRRVSGVHLPAFMLESGFVQRRMLAYVQSPCDAVRDFDTVVLPHLRRIAEARRWTFTQDSAWISQELQWIRRGFACDGDGQLRPETRDDWLATDFVLHFYNVEGKAEVSLMIRPSWHAVSERGRGPAEWPRAEERMRWLPAQFPPPAQLDQTPPPNH